MIHTTVNTQGRNEKLGPTVAKLSCSQNTSKQILLHRAASQSALSVVMTNPIVQFKGPSSLGNSSRTKSVSHRLTHLSLAHWDILATAVSLHVRQKQYQGHVACCRTDAQPGLDLACRTRMPTVRQRQPEPLHVICILEGLPNIHTSIPTYQVVWHQQTAWQRALAWPATAAAYMPHAGAPAAVTGTPQTLDTLHKLWQAGINRLQVVPAAAQQRQHLHRWCECKNRSSAPKQKTRPLNHVLAGNKGCPCRNAGVGTAHTKGGKPPLWRS